jgi:pimeloyl-ACP methyl ester carboxylesterase
MASISEREQREIEAANASGNTPVIFIHGLWLLPASWTSWADFFTQAGYAPLTPDWPDDPETVQLARANPDVLAKKTLEQVADHTTDIINALDKKPVVMGHSTGGLLAQMLAGRGLSAVAVAIDPGVFRDVLPLPASVLRGLGLFLVNPLTRGRAITLTFDQFKYAWATRWRRRKPSSSTRNSTSPAQGSLSSRWATPTSTLGQKRRSTRQTPAAVPC